MATFTATDERAMFIQAVQLASYRAGSLSASKIAELEEIPSWSWEITPGILGVFGVVKMRHEMGQLEAEFFDEFDDIPSWSWEITAEENDAIDSFE
jgi:hypothetical protein